MSEDTPPRTPHLREVPPIGSTEPPRAPTPEPARQPMGLTPEEAEQIERDTALRAAAYTILVKQTTQDQMRQELARMGWPPEQVADYMQMLDEYLQPLREALDTAEQGGQDPGTAVDLVNRVGDRLLTILGDDTFTGVDVTIRLYHASPDDVHAEVATHYSPKVYDVQDTDAQIVRLATRDPRKLGDLVEKALISTAGKAGG